MIFNKIRKYLNFTLEKNNWFCGSYNIEKTKNIKFGDFSSNIAMVLGKELKINPIEVANKILSVIPKDEFKKIEIVNPGFINFYINDIDINNVLNEIINKNNEFPLFDKKNELINIEFVSANPTGLLHIGHARNAVFGDCLSRIMSKSGYFVEKEYLINDAGNQMNKLAYSVLIRYKQLFNINIELADDSYHGEEIKDVALLLKKEFYNKFVDIEIENDLIKDKEINEIISNFSKEFFLNKIKQDLRELDIEFDIFFSEKFDHSKNILQETIQSLGNDTFKMDGAIWLDTIKYGDDKNRVLLKQDGTATYFLPDIAYHKVKIERNKPKKLINIWGSDHHSYIKRMQIALEILGYKNKLDVVCMQLVRLIKDGKEFKLSKRTGETLTLLDLVQTIGKDATRWFLISTSPNTHIELDINLALSKNNKNPMYYVQYAHVRAYNLIKKSDFSIDNISFIKDLDADVEKELINYLIDYKNIINQAAIKYEPFRITNYLLNLSKLFHSYYSNVNILKIKDDNKIKSKLLLIKCIQIVINNTLNLLGINAYTEM